MKGCGNKRCGYCYPRYSVKERRLTEQAEALTERICDTCGHLVTDHAEWCDELSYH
jgi:hypothetical protein